MRPLMLRTERLELRHLEPRDAAFILELVNDPDWLRHIGDRNVRTLDDALVYIETGPRAMYAQHGFGLDLVSLQDGGAPIGICGLLRRDSLDDADLGFALLPRFRGHGYAAEAAAAALAHAGAVLGLERVVAITSPANAPSARLLERLGFRFERALHAESDRETLHLYGCALKHEPPATS